MWALLPCIMNFCGDYPLFWNHSLKKTKNLSNVRPNAGGTVVPGYNDTGYSRKPDLLFSKNPGFSGK